MSTDNDRGAVSSIVPLDHSAPPPLSAAFLIKFDLNVGYTITWKRSAPGVQLDGSVEFKSLPSGLHTVKEDLVYFVHDGYAGLSAFVNAPAAESERNASLVAVGVLVPLSNARLGRGWLHAQRLRELAQDLAQDPSKTEPLEQLWDKYKATTEEEAHAVDTSDRPSNSTSSNVVTPKHSRQRALSSLTNVLPSEQSLPPFHPALSMMEYGETFGPLIFPIWRAALLRKRILLMSSPPVRRLCEFVFDISILSNIPASSSEFLSPDTESFQRIRPIFQVGIYDIPTLEKEAKSMTEASRARHNDESCEPFGFLACTTDEVLALKKNLYDVLIEIPAISEHEPQKRQWPKLTTSDGVEIKATQRDLRRWKLLYEQIARFRREEASYRDDEEDTEDNESRFSDRAPLVRKNSNTSTESLDDSGYDDKLIEPMTWSQLAYSGFMWWASAGERDAALSEEDEKDRLILGHLSDFYAPSPTATSPTASRSNGHAAPRRTMSSSHGSILPSESAGLHTGLVAYFHRLTSQIISTMAEVVESADDRVDTEDDDDDAGPAQRVEVSSEDISRMGLEVWSAADVRFAQDALRLYFGREADVRGASIDLCGVRIC